MTEDEAKTKWCPHARLSDMGSYNRCGPEAHLNCIGSNCMAWRVIRRLSVNNSSKIPGRGQSFDESTGYCGLAGHP